MHKIEANYPIEISVDEKNWNLREIAMLMEIALTKGFLMTVGFPSKFKYFHGLSYSRL